MTQQQRTGLLAIGIVGGAFTVVGIVVAIVAASGSSSAGREGGREVAKGGLVDRPMSTGSASDDESYIRGHRWWKQKLTDKQLEKMVAKLVETNQGRGVVFVGSGDCFNADDKIIREDRDFYIKCEWSTRPTRDQALKRIRKQLDEEEYKAGPGR